MLQTFVRSFCNLSQISFKSQTETAIANKWEHLMRTKVWIRPEVKQIHLGCEINSYAPAEI
jgi:coenzyme PQQ precursor peptide PqqA